MGVVPSRSPSLRAVPVACFALTVIAAVVGQHVEVVRDGPTPVVNISSGPVRGYTQNTSGVVMTVFRGIPFAEPPLGRSGRWKPPTPPVRCSAGLPPDATVIRTGNTTFDGDL